MKNKKTTKIPPLLIVRSRTLNTFHYLLLFVLLVIVVVPVLIFVFMSFKTPEEYVNSGIFQLPKNFFNVTNYIFFIEESNLGLAFRNTLVLIIVSVPVSIMLGSMLAYVLDRFRFRLHGIITALFTMAVIIPSATTQVALFSLIQKLGLYNTIFAGMFLFIATDVVQIYIFRQFISSVPVEIDESGRVEGASLFTVFFRLILPQLIPAFATVAITKGLGIYNNLLVPYLYMPKNSLRTVGQTIRLFVTDNGGRWPVISAGVILILFPTIVMYLFAQRYLIAGLTNGSVKG